MSDDLFSIESIQHEHDCGCEFCSKTLQVCPASASSYAQEILSLRLENALAEFLGPTIEMINYLLGSGETTAFKRARLEKEKMRLTSAIGGGK